MPIINLLDFGNADTMFLKDPSNLRINGETSQIVEAETCHLTWNAAEVDPPQDITYYVNIGPAQKNYRKFILGSRKSFAIYYIYIY